MIWSIAWKNVWRNRKRSLVVIIAVTLGIISGLLLIGIMEGWIKQRLNDAIYNEVSHIQIHNSDFIKNEEIQLMVENPGKVGRNIESLKEVSGWVKRTKLVAMANTSWANTGVMLYGIDPENEKKITEIYKKIVPGGGKYLDDEGSAEILISDKTAELLKLKQYIITDSIIEGLRDERVPEEVLTALSALRDMRYRSPKDFTDALRGGLNNKELNKYGLLITGKALIYRIRNKVQVTISDREGTPVQGVFRVCGIFKTTNTGFDQMAAFVNAPDLAELYGGGEILTHEIAILLNDIDDSETVGEKLKRSSGNNLVSTWKELAPDAAMMNDYMVMYYFIFIGIIMLALAFGIINTMLMAILERTRELGMLMAIGMNRRRIFMMIMAETIFLTVVGALAGMISGWAIAKLLGRTGIHFSGWGEGFEAIGFSARVYPVVTPEFLVFTTVMVFFTAIIASIWPARKALGLNPVETLRME